MSALVTRLRRSSLFIVTGLVVVLLVVNLVLTPRMLAPAQLPNTVNLLVPSVLAAMASVPAVMSGRGGIDLSVGPLLGMVDVVLVGVLLPAGLGAAGVAVPVLLVGGAAAGLVSGVIVAWGRLQPVVVTLGGYLVFSGLALVVMPQPTGVSPDWVAWLAGGWFGGLVPRSLLLIAVAAATWLVLRRRGVISLMLAVGSEDRAAYTAGVRVRGVVCLTYATGGLFAALAGIGVAVLIQSGDPGIGIQYTLPAIAAVAIGGNPLSGGRGTLLGPVLGAIALFGIQTLLSGAHVSALWIQVVYGLVLLAAICVNSSLIGRRAARFEPEMP